MKSYQEVYKILAHETDYLSGEKIAEILNLSRTSVWKAIQRLQQEGLEIDSIKNRGYKLLHGDLILPQEIEANSPISVQFKPITKSTQSDAKEAMEAGAKGDTTLPINRPNYGTWSISNAPTILQNKVGFTCLSTSSPISLI